MERVKLTISYRGRRYKGYQIQPNGVSIQEVLQRALKKLYRKDVKVIASGRTDAGVHAVGQVVHFADPKTVPIKRLAAILSRLLPEDIFVLRAKEVENFHSRYDARVRHYRYRLSDLRKNVVYKKENVHYPNHEVDAQWLRRALKPLEGVHNFASFSSSRDASNSKMREIFRSDAYNMGDEVVVDVYGSSFLWNMVRKIVGEGLYAYRKGKDENHLRRVLEARDPGQTKHLAPSEGLTLEGVYYAKLFGERVYYGKKA